MISRVAESCLWLFRYIERAENMARLLRVNRSFVLDVHLPARDRWRPVIVVSGEEKRYVDRFSVEAGFDGAQVQDYLTWDEDNPVSIFSSVKWARENARTIREVISLEMWEALNGLWHWLRSSEGRAAYGEDREAFYRYVQEQSQLLQGVCHNTVLHEQPFDFMRLGMLLERAGQTARIIDVEHHLLGEAPASNGESALEAAQWLALLRMCSATEPFFKRMRRPPQGRAVIAFLVLEPRFPRSVLHCLDRAWNFARRIAADTGRQDALASTALLAALVESVRAHTPATLFERGVHTELTRIIDQTAEVCAAVHGDYFNPTFDALS
ncbi:alpha-E domain-containing protein [Haliangium sp.]|uniref:alpha-E domain-containing protein n=1 Tax=Haliangium sp. TaxID=2663208 RepID=UPI003D11020F